MAHGSKVPLLHATEASAGSAAAGPAAAAAVPGPFAAAAVTLRAAFSQASRPAASSVQSAAAFAAGADACAGAGGGAGVAQWAAAAGPAHCLVLDAGCLTADSADELQMKAVLAAGSEDVLELVLRWMPALRQCGAVCAWVEAPLRRLHVNLATHADLASALVAAPLFVRCGSLPATAWRGATRVCGPQKQVLPEMLQLTCVPTRPQSPAQLQPELERLLSAMQLQETCTWHPSSHQPSRNGVQIIKLNVLTRLASLADLAATIERVHGKHELWGGAVRVHAPNTPSLTRCRDCAQLGHEVNACPRYAGVAWRLMFKEPQSVASMLGLRKLLAADEGYIGHAAGQCVPHRKVTLLFRIDPRDDAAVQQLVQRLVQFTAESGRMLHEPPTHVQTRDRLRECRECNSLDRAHVCPYPQPLALRPGAQKQRAAGALQQPRPAARAPPVSGAAPAGAAAAGPPCRARASASPAAGSRPSASTPGMCHSWRKTKTCPRMQRGERCPHTHPTDHVRWHCFEFAQKGFCSRRGACSYPHIAGDQLQQQQQQRPAVAPPVAPPSAAQQQADGASAMELSDDSGAPAPTTSTAGAAAAPAPAAATSSAPATAAAQSRAAAPSMSTSNSFAALQEHDVDRVASKLPPAAPATPQRSSSRATTAAPAAPPSSLSALASPTTHTSAANTNKRKADGDTTPRDPKSRRNLSRTLSATSASPASSSSAAAADAGGGSKSSSSATGL